MPFLLPLGIALSPCAPVAQLDRAPDYESGGRGFESLRALHFFRVTRPPVCNSCVIKSRFGWLADGWVFYHRSLFQPVQSSVNGPVLAVRVTHDHLETPVT